jgi:acyl carrier protein
VADDAEDMVRSVIAGLHAVNPADIRMDRPLSDAPLRADALDLAEIVVELEESLGVEIAAAVQRKGGTRITPGQLAAVVREALGK